MIKRLSCRLLATGVERSPESGDSLGADVRPQYFGNQNTTIRLLVVLDNRHPCAAYGQSTSVQCVDELSLVLTFRPVAYISAPCLIGFKIRARRNLAE